MEALRHQQLLRRRSEQILGLQSNSNNKAKKGLSGRKKLSVSIHGRMIQLLRRCNGRKCVTIKMC